MSARWLALVGIGEDGADGLSASARERVLNAEHVFGGARHLRHVDGLGDGQRHIWSAPLDDSVAAIAGLRGEKVCVLASGDPFHFGIGATLARTIPIAEMEVFPQPSAFSLAAARLGWALQDVACLSALTRDLETLRPQLQPQRRLMVLTPGAGTPSALAAQLTSWGWGSAAITVLEALGGPAERIRSTRADSFDLADIAALNLVAIETGTATGLVIPLTPGLSDDAFVHDGQITKNDIRALTLSALAPRTGELLWDVGAGAGSIAIEWMLRHPSLRAIAVERDPERARRLAANARTLGVPGVVTIIGDAPAALGGLEAPDAIFIGGGASDPALLELAISALRPGGRLVINAVTLATEALLLVEHARRGGTLRRIAIARAAPVGDMTGWRPAMPVTQWVWHKDIAP